jgi:hypothetical protein
MTMPRGFLNSERSVHTPNGVTKAQGGRKKNMEFQSKLTLTSIWRRSVSVQGIQVERF